VLKYSFDFIAAGSPGKLMVNEGSRIRPFDECLRENPLSEPKHDETFKVVDRRLFTAEGELRKEVAEQQDREHEAATVAAERAARNAPPAAAGPSAARVEPLGATPAAPSAAETPKRAAAFENLVRSLGQNAAMLLGGYADPRTGQPMLDLEGAREMIDMLDVLREKTVGNLAPEEDTLLLDVLGNLKLAFMEMTKAATAAAMQDKVKTRP
jgi:nucleoid-associated protein YgaU